jgi:hypothetical protein
MLTPSAPTPQTRSQTESAIDRLTDPLNSQNTAALVREILRIFKDSYFNRADDRVGLSQVVGLVGALLNKADLDPTTRIVLASQLPPRLFATLTDSPYTNAELAALRLLVYRMSDRYQVRTYAQLVSLASDGGLAPGTLYRITARPGHAATDVLVTAQSPTAVAGDDAYTTAAGLDDAPLTPVAYDLPTDTTTPRAAGGGSPPAGPVYQALSVTAARALAADPEAIAPIRYRVLRGTAGDVELFGFPSDQTNNVPGGFYPVGIWQKPDGTRVFVDYDVTSDTPVPHDGAGDAIPLAGTTPGHDVTGLIRFADPATGNTMAFEVNDGLNLTFYDPAGTPINGYQFDNAGLTLGDEVQLTLFSAGAAVQLAASPAGELLVNGVPVGDSFDPYEVPLPIRQEVVNRFAAQDAAATPGQELPWLDDGQAQPAGSLVGMEFIDPQTQYLYKFRPVPFSNGSPNVWLSTLLSR